MPVIKELPPICLLDGGVQKARLLEGMTKRHVPLNDWLHDALREPIKAIIQDESQYALAFDRLEILIALGHAFYAPRIMGGYWAPLGAFWYREDNRERIMKEISNSLNGEGDSSPFVQSSIFGNSAEECMKNLNELKAFIGRSYLG